MAAVGDLLTRRVPPFEMAELQSAPKHLRIGSSNRIFFSSGDGVVLEIMTHSSFSSHDRLLDAYFKMLATGMYEPS